MLRKANGIVKTEKEIECDFRPHRVTSKYKAPAAEPDFEKLYKYRETFDKNKE